MKTIFLQSLRLAVRATSLYTREAAYCRFMISSGNERFIIRQQNYRTTHTKVSLVQRKRRPRECFLSKTIFLQSLRLAIPVSISKRALAAVLPQVPLHCFRHFLRKVDIVHLSLYFVIGIYLMVGFPSDSFLMPIKLFAYCGNLKLHRACGCFHFHDITLFMSQNGSTYGRHV